MFHWLASLRRLLYHHGRQLQQRLLAIRQRAQGLLVQTLGETIAGLIAELLEQLLEERLPAAAPFSAPSSAPATPLWSQAPTDQEWEDDFPPTSMAPESSVLASEADFEPPTRPQRGWQLWRLATQTAWWWLWYRLGRPPLA